MDELASYVYSIIGLKFPRLFIFIFIILGGFLGFLLASKIAKTHQDSFGVVEGLISLQDGVVPKQVIVEVYQDSKSIQKYLLEENTFKLTLPKGSYSFQFIVDGYHPYVIRTVQVLNGIQFLDDIVLKVIPKRSVVLIKDKDGKAYSNLTFSLLRSGSHSVVTEVQFDSYGNAFISKTLEPNTYSLSLLNEWGVFINNSFNSESIFLWREFSYGDSVNIEVGRFFYPTSKDRIDVILPKVVSTNIKPFDALGGGVMPIPKRGEYRGSGIRDLPSYQTLEIAQRVVLNNEILFCGVAFSSFSFASKRAKKLEIRKDDSGKPSSDILYSSDLVRVADFSGGIQSPFTRFCDDEQVKLGPGIYWLVHYFDEFASSLEFYGVVNDQGTKPLIAFDGMSWEVLESDINEIGYLFVE